MSDTSERLKLSLQSNEVSGFSPAALQHSGMRALVDSHEDSMSDLTAQQVTAFAVLRAYHSLVPIPRTLSFIDNYISLSRSRDRLGRLEYAGCYKSVFVMGTTPGTVAAVPSSETQQSKTGLLSKLWSGRKKDAQQ